MLEPKFTNAEKQKNPKRVEQGKRLAAISREARERKKQQQEKFFESAETEGNKIFFGIGLIGAAFLIYKIFFNSKKVKDEPAEPEDRRLPEDAKLPEDDEPAEPKNRKARSFEPYTID